MNPAFSAAQLRSFLPKFRNSTAKVGEMIEQFCHYAHLPFHHQLCRLWREQVFEDNPEGVVIAVNKWLARTTLDVLGESEY